MSLRLRRDGYGPEERAIRIDLERGAANDVAVLPRDQRGGKMARQTVRGKMMERKESEERLGVAVARRIDPRFHDYRPART